MKPQRPQVIQINLKGKSESGDDSDFVFAIRGLKYGDDPDLKPKTFANNLILFWTKSEVQDWPQTFIKLSKATSVASRPTPERDHLWSETISGARPSLERDHLWSETISGARPPLELQNDFRSLSGAARRLQKSQVP